MSDITVIANQLTMSSREIAELTDKEHKTVMRDIRVMLKGLGQGTDLYLGQYTVNNRTYDEYNLPKRETLLLVSGYMLHVRAKIVDRLEHLEAQASPKIPTNFAEALQLAADQAKQLEMAAPKVQFVDNLVERNTLITATQVAQKFKMSAVKLNRLLDEIGGVYSRSVKRGRVFTQAFIDKGFGEMKQTELGYSQPLFTPAGEVWISEKLFSEGAVTLSARG